MNHLKIYTPIKRKETKRVFVFITLPLPYGGLQLGYVRLVLNAVSSTWAILRCPILVAFYTTHILDLNPGPPRGKSESFDFFLL